MTVVNPTHQGKNGVVRTYVFVGSVPKAVVQAAERAGQWSARDAAVLREFYGADFRTRLSPPVPGQSMLESQLLSWRPVSGGAVDTLDELAAMIGDAVTPRELNAATFQNLDEFNFIDKFKPSDVEVKRSSAPESGPTVYSPIATFPEDTIHDLRQKIFLATRIPPGRQHLFYERADGVVRLPYRVYVGDAPVSSDIRTALTATGGPTLVGVPVDKAIEETVQRTGELRVDALDTFQRLDAEPLQVTRVYVVDLFTVLRPLTDPEAHPDLAGVLRDRYQFDLLYYGGILRFWPQLSPEALHTFLAEPDAVAEKFPLLDPSYRSTETRVRAEQGILERAHAFRIPDAILARTAVTAAVIHVAPRSGRMRVDVRNVFDWVATGPGLPAVTARVPLESGRLSNVAKRHASSFMPRVDAAATWFVEHPDRRVAVSFMLVDPDADPSRAALGLAHITLLEDGNYTISAWWGEDERLTFGDVIKKCIAATAPLTAAVNAMGPAAFPIGGELHPPTDAKLAIVPISTPRGGPASTGDQKKASGDAKSASFGEITAATFWPHAITTAEFQEIVEGLRRYERAGVIAVRGLQQTGTFVFQYRKGVTGYDPSAVDRVIRRPDEKLNLNRYAYLTDPSFATRWAYVYAGRTVRLHHRATDIKVEVVAADGVDEFVEITRSIYALLDGFAAAGRKAHVRVSEGTSKVLKRLQERDPKLFDLKRYDSSATVYSVLCQAGRQPVIYSPEEAAVLRKERKNARLTAYWNFTEGRPAFYACPSPQYPHLRLQSGRHPQGYCLPCCNHTVAAEGSRSARVNAWCLESAMRGAPGPGGPPTEGMDSRHVLAYGKTIPVGRIGEIPSQLSTSLFVDAFASIQQEEPHDGVVAILEPHGGPASLKKGGRTAIGGVSLCLVGVEQSTPAVPAAGFMFAVAHLLSHAANPVETVVRELCAAARGQFTSLASGAAAVFPTSGDLADALVEAFVRRTPALSPLSPGGDAGRSWEEIVTELVFIVHGVHIVRFVDTLGSITVSTSPECVAALTSSSCYNAPPKIAMVMVSEAGVYPIVATNAHTYIRNPPDTRWKLARTVFAAGGDDRVLELLRPVVVAMGRAQTGVVSPPAMLRFLCAHPKRFKTVTKLVNRRGLCYGLMLDGVYFPVQLSRLASDSLPSHFGVRPASDASLRDVMAVVDEVNAFMKKSDRSFVEITPEGTIVDESGGAIGFIAQGLRFYHKREAAKQGVTTLMPYDPREVDEALHRYTGASGAAPPSGTRIATSGAAPPSGTRIATVNSSLDDLAAREAYTNNTYRLLLAEFAAALYGERDETIRSWLLAAVKRTRFNSPASITQFRDELVARLAAFPAALSTIQSIIAKTYAAGGQAAAISAAVVSAVEATAFDFDKKTLHRLQKLKDHAAVLGELRKLLTPRVQPVDAPGEAVADAKERLGNMFAACVLDTTVPRPQCYGGKLVIDRAKFGPLLDILASDILNRYKTPMMGSSTAGVIDETRFIERPGEKLIVR
ncbi:MAG: hypothetical protein KGL39_10910 [Patescibacteria group bacterium]|nr:hypothetical protein [Patescibacteria group bacterium]